MQKWFWVLLASVLAGAAWAQAPAPAPTVSAGSKGSLIKIDGRLFVGIFASGAQGAYPNRALDVPDAKLRFTFTPSKDITIVNRFSNNKATTNGFDYFYVDVNNWGGALPGHTLRLGKVKLDVGEETWTDNPVENILISNSAAAVGGYDAGLNFRGPLGKRLPASYSLGVYNGTGSLGTAANGLAASAKVSVAPAKDLYVSASYADTGELIKADGTVSSPALKVANLQKVPTSATAWQRSLWEVDARWHYGQTGVRAVIPSGGATPRVQLGAAYGHFRDNFDGAADRAGNYWYAEARYNATEKLYLATRYSEVTLEDGQMAALADSPVAVNGYTRRSLGAGYHLTPLTDIKAEYSSNDTHGGASQPHLNQFAIGLATKF